MYVFIAHAEADAAAAEDLKAFLKTRGLVVETEDGARGFRHLQHSDVVIALWSQKAVFGVHRMQMERRMLEAWADQRLVLVKLDHGFLPVGMRDLQAIDASFESGRQLSVWPQVERQAKEKMNAALAEAQATHEQKPTGLKFAKRKVGDAGPDEGGEKGRWAEDRKAQAGRIERRTGSPFLSLLFVLVAMAATAAASYLLLWPKPASPSDDARMQRANDFAYNLDQATALTISGAAIVGVGLVALLIASAMRGSKRGKAKRAEAVGAAPASAPEAEEAGPTTLFISYSHADDAAVNPVVAVVEANGRAVWIDKQKIQTGDGWAGEIVRAIKSAHGVIVMCSKHAFESDHVKREVYLADRYKKPMAPVFLEQAMPPEDFEYFFANVQWLELYKLPEAERAAAIGQALKAV